MLDSRLKISLISIKKVTKEATTKKLPDVILLALKCQSLRSSELVSHRLPTPIHARKNKEVKKVDFKNELEGSIDGC